MPEKDPAETTGGNRNRVNLESLAKLCSVGAVPIPSDLPSFQQNSLSLEIAKIRRKRLLNLFAAAIAEDIRRERQNLEKPDAN